MTFTEKQIKNFFDRVNKTNSCWIWTAGKGYRGYGRFHIGGQKLIGAHRFSYMLHVGEIPDGLLVCHTCDNPPCVNPKHLFVGTDKDNSLDAQRKGRLISPPQPRKHPSFASYKRGCRCEECRKINSDYYKSYYKIRQTGGRPIYVPVV